MVLDYVRRKFYFPLAKSPKYLYNSNYGCDRLSFVYQVCKPFIWSAHFFHIRRDAYGISHQVLIICSEQERSHFT